MHTLKLVLGFILALTVSAAPLNSTQLLDIYYGTETSNIDRRDGDRFKLHVWNNCPFTKEFALYEATEAGMVQKSPSINLPTGGGHVFHPRFEAVSMRLTGHAELGADGQWGPQLLFEFGYSAWNGLTGTSYDISMMPGSDPDIGMGVWPSNPACASKLCWPGNSLLDQCWTDPSQVNLGSPADYTCYQGKTDFKVVFCP